ncbi:hypothetical protein KL938_000543 [Ogataea parapolymorpha]|nr:hypothetical protein KL938_000543 [Ogataea parapolymorpha]
MPTVTFVTGNPKKLEEVVAILSDGSPQSVDGGSKVGNYIIKNEKLDLDEIQGSIEEVTIHKAKQAAKLLGAPVIVEDTCLGFNALNDLPGPYIKWFHQKLGLDGLNKLLYGFEDKSANAITTFGYCEGPDADVKLFQGVTTGEIVPSRGPQDFGFDSIFEPHGMGKTYAELRGPQKNRISHRSKALAKLKEFLLSQ